MIMVRWLLLGVMLAFPSLARGADDQVQILELRTYILRDGDAEQTLDDYLQQALIPALTRQGLGPIGAFEPANKVEEDEPQVMLLVAGPDIESVVSAGAKLADDSEFVRAAKAYWETPADETPIVRIRSELLRAFECWPQVVAPRQTEGGRPRLFELRIYESPTEKAGRLKVEMFNAGEVPIFLDCGIVPVFMGEALIGDKLPNLTYMTVYDDEAERDAAWKKFTEHPDWQTLKAVQKYKGTVSKIHKSDWRAKPYSQL